VNRFPLGKLVATPGALEALEDSGQSPSEFIERHASGDWGDLSEDDMAENNFSVDKHLRILSAYNTSKGVRVYVITEADRSVTTLLRADEY
jgi:hypothetical protein